MGESERNGFQQAADSSQGFLSKKLSNYCLPTNNHYPFPIPYN